MSLYLDVLVITETPEEAELINIHTDGSLLAKSYGSQLIGIRTNRIIRAYDATKVREIRGSKYADVYEKYELTRTLNTKGDTE